MSGRCCEVCGRGGKRVENAGPFKLDDGRRLAFVCVRCKIRLTFTPVRAGKFERELSVGLSEMTGERCVVTLVNVPVGDDEDDDDDDGEPGPRNMIDRRMR
jgi:hypothetical protein